MFLVVVAMFLVEIVVSCVDFGCLESSQLHGNAQYVMPSISSKEFVALFVFVLVAARCFSLSVPAPWTSL